jgi:hypothetical protein
MDDEVTRYATQQPSTVDEFEYLCREVAGIWNDPDPLTEPLGGPVRAALTFATGTNAVAALRVHRRLSRIVTAYRMAIAVMVVAAMVAVMTSSRAQADGTAHHPAVIALLVAGVALFAYGIHRLVRLGSTPIDVEAVTAEVEGAGADIEAIFAASMHLARHLAADGRRREVDTVREILLNFLDFEVRGLRETLERNRLPDERRARSGMQHADLSLAREADALEGRLAAIAAGQGA